MKVFVHGLHACLQRRCDVQRYSNYIKACGHELTPNAEDSDIALLWSCAFREDYCNNSLAVIKDFQKRLGKDRVVVCGCLPGINESLLKSEFKGKYFKWREDNEGIKAIFGDKGKDFAATRRIIAEPNITENIDVYRKEHPKEDVSYYDQFVKLYISEGCRYDCSYCAEKLSFPKYKSFPLDDLVNQCRKLVKETNRSKVALIADSLGDYGKDTGNSSLVKLIDAILGIRDDIQVALMNLHPTDFIANFDYLASKLREKKIFHLSIPVQSASDRILKLMNRPYTQKDLHRIFAELNRLNFKECETHLIVGFPQESEEDFQESLDFMLKYKPKYIMASSYMESAPMKSSTLTGKVPPETIKRRLLFLAEKLIACGIICNYDTCEYTQEQFHRQETNVK